MRIWIQPNGNFGNRVLQYLAACGIRARAPDAVIENIALPECGIEQPAPAPALRDSADTGRGWIDAAGYADCLRRQVVETVIIDDYPFHLENFPARESARLLVPALRQGEDATGFGADELVCSVRGAEILTGIHPDYLVLPPQYYAMLARRSGLKLVFFGQIGDDAYSDSLRRAFPDARFIRGRDLHYDFEMLRRSVNIAPSVSTFAWAAAWLSHAKRVFLPVCGFLSPAQHPAMLFLPLADETFDYTLCPYAQAEDLWANPARFFLAQDMLAQFMRPAAPDELREIVSRVKRHHPRRPLLTGFDPEFYVRTYPEVGGLLESGFPSALHHYIHVGFAAGLQPMALDRSFYADTYPAAAMAIAEGAFADPLHHDQAEGWARGFAPGP